ncbi:hypothetical protein OROGR_018568 [Orobanche gracilis]
MQKRTPEIFLLAVLASLLVASAMSGVNHRDFPAEAVVRATCAATLYPELCISTVNEAATLKSTCGTAYYPEICTSTTTTTPAAIGSRKDVLMAAIMYTITAVERNYFAIKRISSHSNSLTGRQERALEDCLEMTDYTLDELWDTYRILKDYSLVGRKDDIMTFLSTAQANQNSCLDGFEADKKVRRTLFPGQTHVFRLVSNLLAIMKSLTEETEMADKIPGWKIIGGEDGWPRWLSKGDRRMLHAAAATMVPNVTVAADGSGDYTTITEAVGGAPKKSSERYVIRIKGGVYKENVEVPKSKTNLMFVGDGRTRTIITGNRSVGGNYSTFRSATVAVSGDGFLARDLTIENTAGPSNYQAVALRVSADLTAFYSCTMSAYQDTLYAHSLRQFYTRCTIIGSVDFIFGRGSAALQDCDIRARRPNPGQRNMVTADGRADPGQNTGIVIQKSRISATTDLQLVQSDFPTYLGRPWGEYSRTVVMQTEITDVIHPKGWYRWNNSDYGLDTCFYAEYKNTGDGANTTNRVKWKGFRVLAGDDEAEAFTVGKFVSGEEWIPMTGFPYFLGL